MKDWLYPGAKVVFVGSLGKVTMRYDHGWRRFVPGFREIRITHNLVAGETYTVAATSTHTDLITGCEVVVIYLRGFRYREADAKGLAFPSSWFRPLTKRKTDISVFKALLNTTPSREAADA